MEFDIDSTRCVVIARGNWFCGYVKTTLDAGIKTYKALNENHDLSEEITFSDKLDGQSGIFIGFDNMHDWDNSDLRSMKKRTEKLCYELQELGLTKSR